MEIRIKISAQDALELLRGRPKTDESASEQVNVAISNIVDKTKTRAQPATKIVQHSWSDKEKAWLLTAATPVKANGHHLATLNKLFGTVRTAKSVSACWYRLQRQN